MADLCIAELQGNGAGTNLSSYTPQAGDVNAAFTAVLPDPIIQNSGSSAFYVFTTGATVEGGYTCNTSVPGSGVGLLTVGINVFKATQAAYTQGGVIIGWVDSNNYTKVVTYWDGSASLFEITRFVSGTPTNVATIGVTFGTGVARRVEIVYDPVSDNIKAYFYDPAGSPVQIGTGGGYTLGGTAVLGNEVGVYTVAFSSNDGATTGTLVAQFAATYTAGTALTAGVATATSISTGACTISGTTATGGTSPYDYQLQRGTDGVAFGTNVGSQQVNVAGAPTPQADSGLTDGSLYYYRWQAIDAAGSPATVYTAGIPVVPHVAGSTFHVATGGSDSNNGLTTGAPWQTVTRAQAYLDGSILAGDSLVFNGGQSFDWNPIVARPAVSNPPTSGSPFTMGSYGSGQATFDADDGAGVTVNDVEWVVVSNLIITGSGVSSSGVTTSTGNGVRFNVTGSDDREGWEVNTCTISGFGQRNISFNRNTGAAGLVIEPQAVGNTLYDGAAFGIEPAHGSTGSETDNDSVIDPYLGYNTIYQIYGNGTTNSGYGIILLNCDGGLVEGNLVHHCGQASDPAEPGGPVGIMCLYTDGATVRLNEVHHQFTTEEDDGEGIDFDAGATNNIAERNYIHDCDGPAFLVYDSTSQNNTIRFNICKNNGRRTINTSVTVNDATFLGNHGPGTIVYNNFDYSENATGAETQTIKDAGGTATIRDNIFKAKGSGRTFGVIAATSTLNPNRYDFTDSATISGTDGGTPFANFAALQALGQEAGGSSGASDLLDPDNLGTDYPLGDFSGLTGANPTTSAIWDGGTNTQTYDGPDFHGNTMPTPVTGEYPLGAVGFAAAGARRRRALVTRNS